MDNGQLIMEFQGNKIRIRVEADDELWFVAKDVCDVLGLQNPSDVAKSLDPDELRIALIYTSTNVARNTMMWSESGTYKCALKSIKPEAKLFQRWVTREVLPSIRKTGSYSIPQTPVTDRLLEEPERLIELLIKEHAEKRKFRDKYTALLPVAQYAKDIQDSPDLVPTSVIAKQLGISAKKLHEFLHEQRIIYKCNGTWMFYAKYQNAGLGKIITHSYIKPDGTTGTADQLKWLQKGRQLCHQRYTSLNNHNQTPGLDLPTQPPA